MNRVKIIECPRDAWQGLPRQIPTALKVQYLRALIDGGLRHIDAVSFVSAKAVPQMADSEEVLRQLQPSREVEIIGIVVNERGAERAIATSAVTTLGFPCSVSPTFLRRNQNQSPEENWSILGRIKKLADAAGLGMVVYVSMAFGNRYGDRWNGGEVADVATRLAELGVAAISLADTIGMAEPQLISDVVGHVLRDCRGREIGVHMHSTRANACEKVLSAYDAGCRRFDSALGGMGGCPFAQDRMVGNIPTEEVMRALTERGGVVTVDLESVVTLNSRIADEFAH